MPLQNRVTPFGDIVAIEQRGMFLGNRGIIHDPATRTLLTRRWTNKAWIICRCDFRGVRRKVMSRRSWTELFFLDEATALSAGHRPCYYCRRESALAFADCLGTRTSPGARERRADRHPAARRTSARRREAHSSAARHTGRIARWRDGGVVGRCLPDGRRPGVPLERSRLRGTASSAARRRPAHAAIDRGDAARRIRLRSASERVRRPRFGDRQVTVCS